MKHDRHDNQRLTHKEIMESYSRLGLTIVDDLSRYKNTKTKFTAVDKDGYKTYMTVQSVKKSKRYQRFDKSNPYTLDNIKLWLKLNDPDYELLSTEYLGADEKYEWRMKSRPDLKPFYTTWADFRTDGNRHPDLSIERQIKSRRKKPKQVRDDIETKLKQSYPDWSLDFGEEFDFETVKHSYLTFTHKLGYKSQSTYAQIHNDKQKTLVLFHPSYPDTSIHNMELWTHLNSKYEMVKGQTYTKFRDKYKFICSIHDEFINNFSTIYSYDTGCQDCIAEAHHGQGNPNWNPDIPDDERVFRTSRHKYTEGYHRWHRLSLERDNHTCQICGSKENPVVHHKDGFHWAIDRRTDLTNSVTLCNICHDNFHKYYGRYHNTEEQFEEYAEEMKKIISEVTKDDKYNTSSNVSEAL